MEAVLDIYGLPYNMEAPVIVMDEQPVQPPPESFTGRPNNASRKHARRLPQRETLRGVSITNTKGLQRTRDLAWAWSAFGPGAKPK